MMGGRHRQEADCVTPVWSSVLMMMPIGFSESFCDLSVAGKKTCIGSCVWLVELLPESAEA